MDVRWKIYGRLYEALGGPGRPWLDQAEYRELRLVPERLVDSPESQIEDLGNQEARM
jgi:hypothetical protein